MGKPLVNLSLNCYQSLPGKGVDYLVARKVLIFGHGGFEASALEYVWLVVIDLNRVRALSNCRVQPPTTYWLLP